MYTEASSQSEGDNAKLQLAVPGSMGNLTTCLTFFFHMYGREMGTLNVFSGDTMILAASGDHGNSWNKLTRTVNLSDVVSMPKLCSESLSMFCQTKRKYLLVKPIIPSKS